jgi:hypothetical protein
MGNWVTDGVAMKVGGWGRDGLTVSNENFDIE